MNRKTVTENTYYIDPASGDDACEGTYPSRPFKTFAGRKFTGGDTILFKRGSVIRDVLQPCNGSQGAPVTYGAYGEGNKPAFLGSVPAGDPGNWMEERPSVWRYTEKFSSEICNLIFNGGESCGNLRWSTDELRLQGEWHYTAIGTMSGDSGTGLDEGILYLFSSDNPGRYYTDIECALWGQRRLAGGQSYVVLKDLCFRNAGVHGYQEYHAHDVVISGCEFRFIGGAVWNRSRRIRFGNAVELWDGAQDVTVEHCLFDNIYDAGVTHQGGETKNIPEQIRFRDNLFINCGFAAYECREPSKEIYFEYNTCVNSGGGFSMQGEEPPRQSEIYPQPVGHHVFIWRIEPDTQPGLVYIRNNIFYETPYGTAIYSIISQNDERKFIFDRNLYWQTSGDRLIFFGGKYYLPSEFESYRSESGQDRNSILAEPLFEDDYRQRADSPGSGMGMR